MPKKALLLIITLACSVALNAFHIVGGDMTYKCLGGNSYEITMVIYRDCNSQGADFDMPGNIAIYNDTLFRNLKLRPQGIEKIPADIYDPCFEVPTGVCVQKGFYQTTIILPPNWNGYTISYQRCCRNVSLRNIDKPDKVGTTITTNIPGSLQHGCNSSPIFKKSPPLAICYGSDFNFDHGAIDSDGDSLVYKFCDPFLGGSDVIQAFGPANGIGPIPATRPPYTTVPWKAGYSATNPFNIGVPFQIDPLTGVITGIPELIGQYLYGICVEEYRNGVKIGESRREFQVNIVICKSNTEALFDDINPCIGLEQTFNNNSITSRTFLWDFDLNNSGVNTSTSKDPSYTFPDTGTYIVRLIANPQYDCADTIEKTVKVFPPISPELIQGEEFACLSNPNFLYVAGGTYEPYTKIHWSFTDGASIKSDTGLQTKFTFPQIGKFNVDLTMSHAVCSATVTINAEVVANPELDLATRNTEGCSPLLVQLENLSKAESPMITVWTLTKKLKSSSISTNAQERWRFDEPGDYNITLLTYTNTKCKDTLGPIDIPIKVYESPIAHFSLSDTLVSVFNPEIEIIASPKRAVDCELYVGKTDPENGCSGLFLFDEPGEYLVSQLVTSETGCTDTLSKTIIVENEYAFFAPNSFSPNIDGRNEEFRPVVIGSKEYQLTIHDRWGHIIFTTSDPKAGWDGTNSLKQEAAPVGVYLFQARVMDHLDEFHLYSGEINLFR